MSLPSKPDLREIVQRAIVEISGRPRSTWDSDVRLDDLGLSSLLLSEVLVTVEDETGEEIPPAVLEPLANVETVGQLIDAVAQWPDAQ